VPRAAVQKAISPKKSPARRLSLTSSRGSGRHRSKAERTPGPVYLLVRKSRPERSVGHPGWRSVVALWRCTRESGTACNFSRTTFGIPRAISACLAYWAQSRSRCCHLRSVHNGLTPARGHPRSVSVAAVRTALPIASSAQSPPIMIAHRILGWYRPDLGLALEAAAYEHGRDQAGLRWPLIISTVKACAERLRRWRRRCTRRGRL